MKNAFEFKTLAEFLEYFHDEKTCVEEFTKMRFRNGEYCPHCGHSKIHLFSNGKRYRCAKCKKDFTIRTNSVFGESKLPLRQWFIAIYLLSTSGKGISSVQLGKPPKRGEVNGFSDASRRRMLDLMAKIEASQVPVFVTLTYPDSFPIYSHEFKRHLEMFCARLQRRWPEAVVIWRLEFQVRKSGENKGKVAPHYHLFLYNLPLEFPFQTERGENFSLRRVKNSGGLAVWRREIFQYGCLAEQLSVSFCRGDTLPEPLDNLKQWISRHWYDVVDSGDVLHLLAYLNCLKEQRVRKDKLASAIVAADHRHFVEAGS